MESRFQAVVAAIGSGNVGTAMEFMEPEATLGVHGVAGPNGAVIRQDVQGTEQIRAFMIQAGAPPQLRMTPDTFTRTGDSVTQTGDWSIAGQETGTFVVDWHRGDAGEWRIRRMRLEGTH